MECYENTEKKVFFEENKKTKFKSKEMKDLMKFLSIEDRFDCSGMCRPSLFYFSKNINKFAYPQETCLNEIKQYLQESGKTYKTSTYLLSFNSLFLSILACFLYRKNEGNKQFNELSDFKSNQTGRNMMYQTGKSPPAGT